MATNFRCPEVAVVRALVMDSIQNANSGHPGAPMGMAEVASVLWRHFINHNPLNPNWVNRDRFVLSNGHASMLLYTVLHLTGYDLPIKELQQFRQFYSKTPGHPEYSATPGIETTTGPLGQGFANAVGMAIAEKILSAQFNRPGYNIVDHNTWVSVGDGCLMEGISHEAASLAGKLGLHKLKAIYDDNGMSIDGRVEDWFTDNTPVRFEAYGWHVIRDVDGHDTDALNEAFKEAICVKNKPVLVCTKTIIGKGAPNKEGTERVHGSPLGIDEIRETREAIGWEYQPFEIPSELYHEWDCRKKGTEAERIWNELFISYKKNYPTLASEFERRTTGGLKSNFDNLINDMLDIIQHKTEIMSTRHASQTSLSILSPALPELLGGSADLSSSNAINHNNAKPITKYPDGNIIHYGVREFAMSAIANGISLHGGFIPFVATFLVFSDYARNAVRMSALMKQRVIYVYTHDSICVGEDGPTHQPVEHLWSLRLIPNLEVWRPCNITETFIAWTEAIKHYNGPSALVFSRHSIPNQTLNRAQIDNVKRGGYILVNSVTENASNYKQAIIVATGSEVHLAVVAAEKLMLQDIAVSVVSMPCVERFEKQDEIYKHTVLPVGIPVFTIEAGSAGGWWKYTKQGSNIISIDQFGSSAPQKYLYEFFGFTVNNLVNKVAGALNLN